MKTKDWVVIGGLVALWYWFEQSGESYPLSPVTTPSYPGGPIDPVTGLPTGTPENPITAQQDVSGAIAIDLQTGKVLEGAGALIGGAGASAAGASATGLALGLSATAWTLIGAAVVGVIALVYALRSDVHLYADELVQKYENPFGNYVIQIIKHMTDTWNGSTLLKADAESMLTAVQSAWTNYQSIMRQLMAKSTDWLIVSKQSLNNLDNQFQGETLPNGKVLGLGMGGVYPNGFMTQWLRWMQSVTDSLTT